MAAQTSTQTVDAKPVSIKALVDKEKNRVVFVESNKDFVDILLSFLTMPMGAIIRLTRQPPSFEIGCMSNLYASVQNLDATSFRNSVCKKMLLYPKNPAAAFFHNLKVDIDQGASYYGCLLADCTATGYKLLSHYNSVYCYCQKPMNRTFTMLQADNQDKGAFVKEQARFLVTDELQVIPPSTAACFSILRKLGITDASVVEERTFNIGSNEVLKLLKCSLVSETPLTETLLQHKPVSELSKGGGSIKHEIKERESNGTYKKITVRLVVRKSERMVCYAEVEEDFVDLLLSFLTIPLGSIAKEMSYGFSNGSINHLYRSVQDLDAERHLKSNEHREILLSPKIAPGFGYGNQPLGLEEAKQVYLSDKSGKYIYLTTSITNRYPVLTLMDPKSCGKKNEIAGEFVLKPGKFMVTDDLIITPISSLLGLSTLKKRKAPFSDIEERVEVIGEAEAWRLLVACLTSKSVPTDTFIRKESNC